MPGKVDQFQVTVPKRLGNAVKRNYAKRRIREFYRLNRHDFPIKGAFIFHLHRTPDNWDETFQQIISWINEIAERRS